jgi:purine catabolism regulator
MVSAAVAGADLHGVAGSASGALRCPVAIVLPALGEAVVWPPDDAVDPKAIVRSVPIRIGHEEVGTVAALGSTDATEEDQRAWLEAAAAAAAVIALMRESREDDLEDTRRALLRTIASGGSADITELVGHARRLGVDLDGGAVAICAQRRSIDATVRLPSTPSALLADLGGGRVLGLLPMSGAEDVGGGAHALAAGLSAQGMEVALSAPRRDTASLPEALREAELLVELAVCDEAGLPGQEETYRLLIGVLLRNREELEQLRAGTIESVVTYDARHHTDLLATLRAFLAHHGSTTETAEAMQLHRHTVGYRLSRVHEVSGLSPYESDGRERLSLGLKAHQILAADERRAQHE